MEKSLTDERILYSFCTDDDLMDAFLADIAKRLKEERCRQDMDVSTLASLSGVSTSAIYRYEKGTKPVSLPVLVKVSHVLGLDIAKVISINNQPIDNQQREETAGEKFSHIVRNQPPEFVCFILDTIEKMLRLFGEK